MPVKTLLKKSIKFSLKPILSVYFKCKSFSLTLDSLCFATVNMILVLKTNLTPDVLDGYFFWSDFHNKDKWTNSVFFMKSMFHYTLIWCKPSLLALFFKICVSLPRFVCLSKGHTETKTPFLWSVKHFFNKLAKGKYHAFEVILQGSLHKRRRFVLVRYVDLLNGTVWK